MLLIPLTDLDKDPDEALFLKLLATLVEVRVRSPKGIEIINKAIQVLGESENSGRLLSQSLH